MKVSRILWLPIFTLTSITLLLSCANKETSIPTDSPSPPTQAEKTPEPTFLW